MYFIPLEPSHRDESNGEINAYMEELIPINFIDLNSTIVQKGPSEKPDITDPLI
ncbi:hypothetical protein RhiirA5_413558 [Rhizophagus irregularis]|uniref:Uncharacterized protein n=1 Tax=Rhizophagus irregularis TaxID=588596 RepID=A0A2N0PW58_9GLOM|nr:hypothetical protein RhiirA5_413558 [Rhizophagus irregularis]